MRGLKFLILGVAIAAGVGAVALVRSELERAKQAAGEAGLPKEVEVVVEETPKAMVLVAAKDMGRGHPLLPDDIAWREWPADMVAESFLTMEARPTMQENAGQYMIKNAVVAGEPITDSKLIKISHPGVMSAMVREGMRAVAIEVAPETGAGGFILPGDYVDVILTRSEEVETRRADGTYREEKILITNTLLRTVKVMAVDTVFAPEGEATTAMKRTATLEVTPDMAELLALGEKAGRVTLALRSLAELVGPDGEPVEEPSPAMAIDVASLARGSLPGQARAGAEATGDRQAAVGPAAAPAPAPAPTTEGEVVIVRGVSRQRAPIK